MDDPILVEKSYIHLSHTRYFNNDNIDSDISKIPLNDYDLIMLGGDMMDLTSVDNFTMDLVDDLYDLGAPTTLWTLGNHDYTNTALVSDYTGRDSYYTYHQDGITYLVLDSQLDTSKIINGQLDLVQSVLDTISESSHLIILTHHLIWLADDGELATMADSISNAPLSDCWYCIQPNNFYTDIYPQLIEIENKGIDVICIGGDIGNRANEYQHLTLDGIQYLASGIFYPKKEENQILRFEHEVTSGLLTWEFLLVKDLIK